MTGRKLQLFGMMLAGLAMFGHTATSQMPGPPPPLDAMDVPPAPHTRDDVGKTLARMSRRYALSDAEAEQIRPILLDERQRHEILMREGSLSEEEQAHSAQALHREEVEKIAAVLTESQRAKYLKDEQRASRRSDNPNEPAPPGDPGGPPPDPGGNPPPQS